MARIAGGHENVRAEDREVLDAGLVGAPDGHGVGRCGGLEADGEEDDLAVGILLARVTASSGE